MSHQEEGSSWSHIQYNSAHIPRENLAGYFHFSGSKVSDIEIRRLFQRAIAPNTTINLLDIHFDKVRELLRHIIQKFLPKIIDASVNRMRFRWRQLEEEGGKRIVVRAIDCLTAVDTCSFLDFFHSGASLLKFCHSMGHPTLAMQLATGIRIGALAAPRSVRKVSMGHCSCLLRIGTTYMSYLAPHNYFWEIE